MIKAIGALMIWLACACFGFIQARHYAKRPQQIRQLIAALQRLESEIVYAQTPLTLAFQRLSHQLCMPFAAWFEQLAARMRNDHQERLGHLWGQAFEKCLPHTSLHQTEVQIILTLGHVLGTSDHRDQVKHLRLSISQLQMEETESRHMQQRYESMWRSLGCMLGALLVILIY